jgi:NADPH:quinone reductase-like Zn-dependent oxidoreductase
MRAVVDDRFGPPDGLRVEDVKRPVRAEDELLVRIQATKVAQTDCHVRAARPHVRRLVLRLRRPRQRTVGTRKVVFSAEGYKRDSVPLLKQLLEARRYRAVVDRTYPLEDVVEATRDVERWQPTGNVGLTVQGAAS